MKTFNNEDLQMYLKNDWIQSLLQKEESAQEKKIRTNMWLSTMENKRMIYSYVYGDILRENNMNKKVLDIGGGYNALTKILARNADYTLVDFMAHGGNQYLEVKSKEYRINWIKNDWYEADLQNDYDIVIANDIFPDVDQRLELFIEKMLPICRELRLVLTYYNTPKFYLTQRTDDSELMTFLSWDGEITALKLQKYLSKMDADIGELNLLRNNTASIYRNGRQVTYVKIKGNL